MKLLLLISGHKDMLYKFPGLIPEEFDIVKIDEKDLSRFGFIRSIINRKKYNIVYFGTLDLDYQRFTFFINSFIMFSHAGRGGIMDEQGNIVNFNIFRYIFKLIPMFIIESISSLFVIAYFYFKFPVLRWLTSKNR